MKKILILLLLIPTLACATLTPSKVPVTKTGGNNPTLQDGDITDNTGSNVSIGVPVTIQGRSVCLSDGTNCISGGSGTVTSGVIGNEAIYTGNTMVGSGHITDTNSGVSVSVPLTAQGASVCTAGNSCTGYQGSLGLNQGTYINGSLCTYSSSGAVINCTANSSGIGSVLSVGTSSPNSTIQSVGGTNPVTTSGTINLDINWTDVNGIAAINTGGINWQSINSISKINETAINWPNIIAQINAVAINWPNISGQINSVAVNWTNLVTPNLNYAGINWLSIPSYATGNILQATTNGGVNWNSIVAAGGSVTSVTAALPILSSGGTTPNITFNWTDVNSITDGKQINMSGINWNDSYNLNYGVNWSQINLIAKTAQTTAAGVGTLKLYDSTGTNWVGLSGITNSFNSAWTLPSTDGTNWQSLTTNGTASLQWGTLIYSPAAWTDPINDYNASGSTTTTTGTITASTKSLSVGSATGWTVGMGISVTNAGNSGGTTNLITSITAISGTTFTLAANALHNETNVTVSHDDTAALQAAINSGRNVHLRATTGCYPVSSVLTINAALIIQGDGNRGRYGNPNGEISTTNGSCIQNEGTTNDVIDINGVGYTKLRDFSIQEDSALTSTAGYGINIIAPNRQFHDDISYVTVYNIYNGLKVGADLMQSNIFASYFNVINYALYQASNINYGDIFYTDDNFQAGSSGIAGFIAGGDSQSFSNDIFFGGSPVLQINDSFGAVQGERFINCSIEGGYSAGNVTIGETGAGVSDIAFIGGENSNTNVSTYNGMTINNSVAGVTITGVLMYLDAGIVLNNSADYISLVGNTFDGMTAGPFDNNGSGTHINIIGNTSSNGGGAINTKIYTFGGSLVVNGNSGVTNTATTTCGCKTFTNGICTTLGTCS